MAVATGRTERGETALLESRREGCRGGELHRAVTTTQSSGRERGIAWWETESSCGKRRWAKPTPVAQSSSGRGIVDAIRFLLDENDLVVLAGVDDIEGDWWKAVTYVGMSRARSRLHVIIHVDCDSIRRDRFELELQRREDSKEIIA